MENMEPRNENGTFKAGHPGFKPKGSANEFQKVTREKLGEFLKSKLDDLPGIYDKLGDRDKGKLLLCVCEFFLPKQKEILIDDQTERGAHIDYTRLSEQTLKEILNATEIHNGE